MCFSPLLLNVKNDMIFFPTILFCEKFFSFILERINHLQNLLLVVCIVIWWTIWLNTWCLFIYLFMARIKVFISTTTNSDPENPTQQQITNSCSLFCSPLQVSIFFSIPAMSRAYIVSRWALLVLPKPLWAPFCFALFFEFLFLKMRTSLFYFVWSALVAIR